MTVARFSAQPADTGLYRREHEHDACGVAMVATMRGTAGHDIVVHAITALQNLDHRGAVGAEPDSGDGAGILTQVPDRFLREVSGLQLPAAGSYAVGLVFLPADRTVGPVSEQIEKIAAEFGLDVLGWREVPTRPEIVGPLARESMPLIRQLFVSSRSGESGLDLERRLWLARKAMERETTAYLRD